MMLRTLKTFLVGAMLLGIGAAILSAQPGQAPRVSPIPGERNKLRAEVAKLRIESEMLRFDYEYARDSLLEDLKLRKGFKMAGGFLSFGMAIQSALNHPETDSTSETKPQQSQAELDEAEKAAKIAEEEAKKEAAEEAEFIAERKKELLRLFTVLTEKRLDLEDAEENYRKLNR